MPIFGFTETIASNLIMQIRFVITGRRSNGKGQLLQSKVIFFFAILLIQPTNKTSCNARFIRPIKKLLFSLDTI